MATPDFDKLFSTNSPNTPFTWTDSDYLEGWSSIQNTPPSRQQFDALQMLSDLKSQYLMQIKAPINSPTFTGDPKAPTPAWNDNDTSLATTAFVRHWVDSLSDDIDDNGGGVVAYSKGNPGYIKFKNGVIIQWGRSSVPSSGTLVVSLPISYTTQYIAIGTDNGAAASNNTHEIGIDSLSSLSQITILGNLLGVPKGGIIGWVTIGY